MAFEAFSYLAAVVCALIDVVDIAGQAPTQGSYYPTQGGTGLVAERAGHGGASHAGTGHGHASA